MTANPTPRLVDLLRGREGDLAPLTLRIVDAALSDDHRGFADIQNAALAATGYLLVQLTPPGKLNARARDAEGVLRRMVRAHKARVEEIGDDLAARQRECQLDLLKAFGDAYRHVVSTQPIPDNWLTAGIVDADHFRKALLAHAVMEGLHDLFAKAFGEQMVDRIGAVLATIDACAVVCAAPFDTDKPDAEGFADMIVEQFRGTLLRTIEYWRQQEGH